jgi:hypothetical protein
MWKKTLMVATLAGGLAAAPMLAQAGHDDRAAGAVAGGLLGALIGSSVNGHNGAAVGGILGAFAGAAIADDRHDDRGHGGYNRYGAYSGYSGYEGRHYGERHWNGYTRAYNNTPSYAFRDGYRNGYRGDYRRY